MTKRGPAYKYSWRNKDLPLRWRFFRWVPTRSEMRVSCYDLRLWLRGTCAFKPYDPEGLGGGYAHWRCQRPRGHDALHRFKNYTSDQQGRVEYSPIPFAGFNTPAPEWAELDMYADKILGQTYRQRVLRSRADRRREQARWEARQTGVVSA